MQRNASLPGASAGSDSPGRDLPGLKEDTPFLEVENRRREGWQSPPRSPFREPGLNTRLLKERLEMEVGLGREGFRAIVFVGVCICLCTALFSATQPTQRNASRWYISQRLNVDNLQAAASSPETVFKSLMEISSASREFFPTSSVFVDDPLSKVLVGNKRSFAAGAEEVPASMHPELTLEWTLTVRLSLQSTTAAAEKRLIVRKFIKDDTSGRSCWAWYATGMMMLTLEYGRHNTDSSYPTLEFDFSSQPNITTDITGFNFASVIVNSTYATMTLEGAGQISLPLESGTIPSNCPDGEMEVGHSGLILGSLKYHPVALSNAKLAEIAYSGQTLVDMACGMERQSSVSSTSDDDTLSHTETQQLVKDYGSANLAVSKLAGTLSFVASGIASSGGLSTYQLSQGQYSDGNVGQPLPVDPVLGLPQWNFSSENSTDSFWQMAETEVLQLSHMPVREMASQELTEAFKGLTEAGIYSFSISWWSKSDSQDNGLAELMMLDFSTGTQRFMVKRFYEEDATNGVSINGWMITWNSAPWCSGSQSELCLKSPAAWCQGPDTGGYDGIWRNYVLKTWSWYPSESLVFIQPYRNTSPEVLRVGLGFPQEPGTDGDEVAVRNVRIYPRLVTEEEIDTLSRDPELMECLDLEYNADTSDWVSEFGQTCAEIADMSVTSAPAACQIQEVQSKCPVSCMHELSPMCYDGTPALPQTGAPIVVPSKSSLATWYILEPILAQEWYASNTSQEQLVALDAVVSFIGGAEDGDWNALYNDIRKLDYGTIIPSQEAIETLTAGLASTMWLAADSSAGLTETTLDPSRTDWCPGIVLDTYFSESATGSLVSDVCMAELTLWATMADLMVENDMADPMEAMGWRNTGFDSGLLSAGTSNTLYFWAKTTDVDSGNAPKLTAFDANKNICWSVGGTSAWLQKRGLVEEFSAWELDPTNTSLFQNNADNTTKQPPWIDSSDYYWEQQRLEIINEETLSANEWAFFALSVDVLKKTVRYAVNSYVTVVDLGDTEWGCDSISFLVNTGPEVDVSPIRIGKFALPVGSLQQLYLASRSDFIDVFTGEERSRVHRTVRVEKTVRTFSGQMVALSPPILLQRREDPSVPENSQCRGNLVETINVQLNQRMEQLCAVPFKCEQAEVNLTCRNTSATHPETFFGQTPIESSPGVYLFPEFAWNLERDVLVRDGMQLKPDQDYIDRHTISVELWMSLFVPTTQVATVFSANMDLSSIRTVTTLRFLQIKILGGCELFASVVWMLAAMVLSVASILLAAPAAVQELREWIAARRGFMQSTLQRLYPTSHNLVSGNTLKKRVYSMNTTQPDLLDVALNLLLLIFCIGFLIKIHRNYDEASDVFSAISSIPWSDDTPIGDKVGQFLISAGEAIVIAEEDGFYSTCSFWILILCCVRVTIYMKIHPSISSVTETFESVGLELINFFFSFGIIFMFLAVIAHIRFGYLYDEFCTFEQSLITLFSVLIGDSSPDYSNNPLMCLFIVGFVFICALSLLNFLLAIVVNGYTEVTERVLENKVAQNLLVDLLNVPMDGFLWFRHRNWPSKLAMLREMQDKFPAVFLDEEEVLCSITEETFHDIVKKASKGKADREDGTKLFRHYRRLEVLHLDEMETEDTADGRQACADSLASGEPMVVRNHSLIRKISSGRQHQQPAAVVCHQCSARISLS